MVTNSFQHADTGQIIEKTFPSIQAQTEWKTENSLFSIIFLAPTLIGDPFHLGVQKVPDDFRQGIVEPMKRHWRRATSHDGHTKVGDIELRQRGRREI